jgi:hypothetical protein
MASQPSIEFSLGLSEEEKRDLENMIGDFQRESACLAAPKASVDTIQQQLDAMNKRLAYLTRMFLTIDRRMQPLCEILRLTFQKSEILNERINTIIESLRSGESLR